MQFARGYIVYSIFMVIGVLAMSLRNDLPEFGVISGIAIVVLVLAFVLSYLAPLLLAGIIVLLVNVSLPVVLTLAFSKEASFDLLLLGVGLALFVLLFDESLYLKIGFMFLICGTFVMLQILPVGHPESLGVDMERLEVASFACNLITVATGMIAVLVLQLRFASTRRILEGVARFGELQAATDPLTGLVNRRPVYDQLERLAREGRASYAIAVLDLDNFKEVNDSFGHECGDAAISLVADVLADSFREEDIVSRWGGDEFVVVIPRVLTVEVPQVLERVRRQVAAAELACKGRRTSLTVSIGAAHGRPGRTPDDCFAAADHALYRAKQEGRDRVILVDDYAPVEPAAKRVDDAL